MDELHILIQQLSEKSVMKRKRAIIALKAHMHRHDAHLARLCLHYVSEHDPCYTVRNIARQAFYLIGEPPEEGSWERHHLFHSE
ncbi:MAG: hypothetical protein V1827_03005 [Candidatus Micrarchaeota archaeon]